MVVYCLTSVLQHPHPAMSYALPCAVDTPSVAVKGEEGAVMLLMGCVTGEVSNYCEPG